MNQNKNKSLSDILSSHLKNYFVLHDGEMPDSGLYALMISEVEKAVIKETMAYTGGVQANAAKILGISRNTLRKKLQDLDLE